MGENGLKIYSFSTSLSFLQRYGLHYGNINYTGGRQLCYYDMFEKLGIGIAQSMSYANEFTSQSCFYTSNGLSREVMSAC